MACASISYRRRSPVLDYERGRVAGPRGRFSLEDKAPVHIADVQCMAEEFRDRCDINLFGTTAREVTAKFVF